MWRSYQRESKAFFVCDSLFVFLRWIFSSTCIRLSSEKFLLNMSVYTQSKFVMYNYRLFTIQP